MTLTQVAAWLLTADLLPEEERSAQLAELLSQVAERVRVTKWNITQEVKRGDLPARMVQPTFNALLADLQSVTAPELLPARETLRAYLHSPQVSEEVAAQLAELLGSRAPLYADLRRIEARSPLLSAQ
jgi:hypothetical protein